MAATQFWSQKGSDPKRKFRFQLEIPGQGGADSIPIWSVKTVTKPKANVATVEHSFLQHTFKYPGRVTWDNITMTLVDPGSPNLAEAWLKKLHKSGYSSPNSTQQQAAVGATTMNKRDSVDALGVVYITMTDQDGVAIERWALYNPWIVSIDWGGQLDYTSDDMAEITCELAFDWADFDKSGKAPGPQLKQ
jgi:hypothetical protein